MKKIKGIIQLTRGSKADWLARNPIVPEDILILIKEEQKLYLADGTTPFAELPVWFDLKTNLDSNHTHEVAVAFSNFIPKPIVNLNKLNLNDESSYVTPKSAKKVMELVFGIEDLDVVVGTFSGYLMEVPTKVWENEFELLIDGKYVPSYRYNILGSKTEIRLDKEYPVNSTFKIRRSTGYTPDEYETQAFTIAKETRAVKLLTKDKALVGHQHEVSDVTGLDTAISNIKADIESIEGSTLDTVLRPNIVSPTDAAIFSDENIYIVGSEFKALDINDILNIAILETSEYPDFRTLNGMWTSQTTTVMIPKGSLGPSRTYYYRLRYQTKSGFKSKYSDTKRFKTNTAFDYAVAPHPTKPASDYIVKTNDMVLATKPIEPVSTHNIGDTVDEGQIFSFTNTVDEYVKDFVPAPVSDWITTRFPNKMEFVYPFLEESGIVDVAFDSKNGIWYAKGSTLYYRAEGADIATEYQATEDIVKINVSDNDRLAVATTTKTFHMLGSGVLQEIVHVDNCNNIFPYDDREFFSVVDNNGFYKKLYATHEGTKIAGMDRVFDDAAFDGKNAIIAIDTYGNVIEWEAVRSPNGLDIAPAVEGVTFKSVNYDFEDERFLLVGSDNGLYSYVPNGTLIKVKECIVPDTVVGGVDRNGLEYAITATGLYRENSKLQEIHDIRNRDVNGYDNWRLPRKEELDSLYHTKLSIEERQKINSRLIGMDITTDTACYLSPSMEAPETSDADIFGTIIPVRDEIPNGYYIVAIGESGRTTSDVIEVAPADYVAAIVYGGKENWKLPSEAEASVLWHSTYVDVSTYTNGILCDSGKVMTNEGAVDAVADTSYGIVAIRYRALDGAIKVNVHWQISDKEDFSNVVYESNFDTTGVNQLYVPKNYIKEDTDYWYRVRNFITEDGLYSNWSAPEVLISIINLTPSISMSVLSGGKVKYRDYENPEVDVITGWITDSATADVFGTTVSSDGTRFISVNNSGVYYKRVSDPGYTKITGMSTTNVTGMDCNAHDKVVVVSRQKGVIIIDPKDMTFKEVDIDIPFIKYLRAIVVANDGTIFIGACNNYNDEIYILRPEATTWEKVGGSNTFTGSIYGMFYAEDEGLLYLTTASNKVFTVAKNDLAVSLVGVTGTTSFAFWKENGIAYQLNSSNGNMYSSTNLSNWTRVGTGIATARHVSVVTA